MGAERRRTRTHKGAPRRLQYLGLQTHLLQLPPFVEALHALLHQEQADAVGRRLGFAVRDSYNQDQVGQPAVGDENLPQDGERAAQSGARDAGQQQMRCPPPPPSGCPTFMLTPCCRSGSSHCHPSWRESEFLEGH